MSSALCLKEHWEQCGACIISDEGGLRLQFTIIKFSTAQGPYSGAPSPFQGLVTIAFVAFIPDGNEAPPCPCIPSPLGSSVKGLVKTEDPGIQDGRSGTDMLSLEDVPHCQGLTWPLFSRNVDLSRRGCSFLHLYLHCFTTLKWTNTPAQLRLIFAH